MVEIIRKGVLPQPAEVPEHLGGAAAAAQTTPLREPRPAGFPLLFTSDMQIIEPVVAFLHEHAIQRAHTADTVRTNAEILYDWFDTLEQNGIAWCDVDAVDLVAYRNRMLTEPSPHTGRAYSIRTINLRVKGVLRFYGWAVRSGWLRTSALLARKEDYSDLRPHHTHTARPTRSRRPDSIFVLRQFESLPFPLTAHQARELLAWLTPPYDLMARWQIYTGLRVSELVRLTLEDVARRSIAPPTHQVIDVIRKGRKQGYVIASASLLEETAGYRSRQRAAWLRRGARKGRRPDHRALFVNNRGVAVKKNSYQRVMLRASAACGFKVTSHTLRATFACLMLARLEQLAKQGAAINPLLIVKVLMGHQQIETTDRYLRAISIDSCSLPEILRSLLDGECQ